MMPSRIRAACRVGGMRRPWAILFGGLVLAGCSNLFAPTVKYEQLKPDVDLPARWYPESGDGELVLVMRPREEWFGHRAGVRITELTSPAGYDAAAFIHYPKGAMELRFFARGIRRAASDLLFSWKIRQHSRIVQEVSVRIIPNDPIRVFCDESEVPVVTVRTP